MTRDGRYISEEIVGGAGRNGDMEKNDEKYADYTRRMVV